MKKYTKVLAAFCATAMIFGSFSATVFADEVAAGDQESSSEKPSDYYDAPSVREDAIAEGFESLDARVKRIEAENNDAQSGNDDTQAGVDDDYPEGYGIPGVNGSKAGTNGDQAGADGDQAGTDGTQSGTDGDQVGTDEPKVDEKTSADQKVDTKKNDDTKAEMAKNGVAEGQDAGSDPVDQPVNNPEEPEQVVLFANGVITQDDIDANVGKLPETSGNYTLGGDVEVTDSGHITAAGSSVVIDLAGHTITYTGTENLYTIGLVEDVEIDGTDWVLVHGDISLTIKDTVGGGLITASQKTKGADDHWISINKVNGIDYPNHGTEANKRGGCILVQNSCTLYLEGGTIKGFHSQSDGGAIHVSNGGHCVMSGGRITDCHSDSVKPNDDGAGAISCHCTSKGTQVGNTLYKSSEDGEAVVSTISLKGSLKITGGQIDNCSGRQGGALRVLRADLEITGGTIEDNTAGANGGGILFTKANTGTFKISGNPVISGNHCSDAKKANVWLNDNVVVTLSGNLSSDAKIEFGGNSTTANFFNINGKSYSLDSFVSNHEGYSAYVSGSYIKLKQIVLPKIEGYQLVVGGEIKLRVAVSLADYANSDTTVDYAYYYLKGTTRVDKAKTVNFSDLATSGSYYTFEIPIESACMTSPITVTINYGSNETVTDDPVTIEKYVFAILDGNYAQDVKDAVNALYIFGTVAMLQFDINRSDPALKPQSREIDGNVYSPTSFKYEIGEGAPYTPATDPDGAFYGASVNFLSKTEVNLYFKKSELGATAPSMTVTYSGNVTDTISATENGSYYVYTVKGPSGDGFAATLFDVPFSFSVGNVSGEYSIDTYLQVVEYKYHGQTDNILLILCEKYYDYAKKFQQL